MSEQQTIKRPIPVTSNDLPLCCPMPDQAVLTQHPRVYLTFDEDHKATCYYCSAVYELVD